MIPKELQTTLQQSFGISFPDQVTKEKLIDALTQRVNELLAGNPDWLFSLLYRLDISEKRLKAIMATEEDIAFKIAMLIYERQLEKIASRAQNKSTEAGDDLAW